MGEFEKEDEGSGRRGVNLWKIWERGGRERKAEGEGEVSSYFPGNFHWSR